MDNEVRVISGIINLELMTYLDSFVPKRDELMIQMEERGRREQIPIISPQVGQLLSFLIRIRRPCQILEVGTAIGYSTLWMAKALQGTTGRITSIEIDPVFHQSAKEYFQQANSSHMITAMLGDARDILPGLEPQFDLIFLDAAKRQYVDFFEAATRLLRPDGLVVADNVLFRGMVADGVNVKKSYRSVVEHLRRYLDLVTNHPDFTTVILPLDDGVAISLREKRTV